MKSVEQRGRAQLVCRPDGGHVERIRERFAQTHGAMEALVVVVGRVHAPLHGQVQLDVGQRGRRREAELLHGEAVHERASASSQAGAWRARRRSGLRGLRRRSPASRRTRGSLRWRCRAPAHLAAVTWRFARGRSATWVANSASRWRSLARVVVTLSTRPPRAQRKLPFLLGVAINPGPPRRWPARGAAPPGCHGKPTPSEAPGARGRARPA